MAKKVPLKSIAYKLHSVGHFPSSFPLKQISYSDFRVEQELAITDLFTELNSMKWSNLNRVLIANL